MTLPAPRSRRAAVLGPPPRCRLSGPFETTQRLRQRHPTPNTQRPTGGPCHPTPKIRGRHPTPKSANTQRPISNTQRPKNFLPLRGLFLYRGRWDTTGCLGGRRRLGAPSPLPFRGGGGEVGGRRRGRGRREEGYRPGPRETGGGRATQRPLKRWTPGRPCRTPNAQHPTPNTQRPKHPTLANNSANTPSILATSIPLQSSRYGPSSYPSGLSQSGLVVDPTPRGRPCRAPNAQTPNAQTPNAQTPNAQTPNAQTPNAQK